MDTCPICFEKLRSPYFCVPCRHIFCYQCISARKNDTCPLCREKIISYNRVQQVSTSDAAKGIDTTYYAQRSKLFCVILMIVFILVDIPSSSGVLRSIVYPPCRDLILIVWEILYIVLMVLFMPFKSLYRLVVEIVVYELYDILLAICYMPLGIGNILMYLPYNAYEGMKTYFFDNSWSAMFQRTVHIGLVLLFLNSAIQMDLLRMFEHIQLKRRFQKICISIIENIERRFKPS